MRILTTWISALLVVTGMSFFLIFQRMKQHEMLNDAFDAGRELGETEGIRTIECTLEGAEWCEKLKRIQLYADCFHRHMPRVAQCQALIQ